MITPITVRCPALRHSLKLLPAVLMLLSAGNSPAQQNSGTATNASPHHPVCAEVSRGPHSRVMRTVTTWTNAAGNIVTRSNAYTEIATGLSHRVGGQWVPSSDQIQITADGAAGTNCQHQVHFAANLNGPGALDLLTPEGYHMTSEIAGLVYFDGTTNVVIALPQDSTGQILPSSTRCSTRTLLPEFRRTSSIIIRRPAASRMWCCASNCHHHPPLGWAATSGSKSGPNLPPRQPRKSANPREPGAILV